MKNINAEEIIAEVINVQTKPQRPLTPKQEEGIKKEKEKDKMTEHHILDNKGGRPKVLLNDPKKKDVKIVEVDIGGRAREI